MGAGSGVIAVVAACSLAGFTVTEKVPACQALTVAVSF